MPYCLDSLIIFLRYFCLYLPCYPAKIQQDLLKYIDTYELFNILDLTLLRFIWGTVSHLYSSTSFVGHYNRELSTITEMMNLQNTQCTYFKIRRKSLSSGESAVKRNYRIDIENESIYQWNLIICHLAWCLCSTQVALNSTHERERSHGEVSL